MAQNIGTEDQSEARVLVIYTGGTIGMILSGQGYAPEPNLLTASLRGQTRFHDPNGASIFSHASSSADYQLWAASRSGRNSPAAAISAVDGIESITVSPAEPGLLVRSSKPILTDTFDDEDDSPKTADDGTSYYEKRLPSLVTPKSSAEGGNNKRIRYAILEWQPLLDSSNMELSDWIRIATDIELNYHNFDAFVILHGTDTMCYSSSALSFMLEDLGKTVIITGAQIPLSQIRNDAVDNLLGALSIAGQYIIPECCLYFNHKLYRGNRVSKVSSDDFNAFDSPNCLPLVEVGINIEVNWSNVLRLRGSKPFRAHKKMCTDVATLRLFPGISGSIMRAFLAPPLQGVVLETFGAGNAPGRADVLNALKEASDRGVVIVAISQCQKGSVSDAYQTGRTLTATGVSAGADMTPECALTKLSYLLSKHLSSEEVRSLIATPLRGELTQQSPEPSFSTAPDGLHDIISSMVRLSSDRPLPRRQPSLFSAVPVQSTGSDQRTVEIALLPFLAQLAAARNDVTSLQMCMSMELDVAPLAHISASPSSTRSRRQARGMINLLDVASGRTVLHVAALHGSEACVNLLLASGALVHLRDVLDHTALYYAARQGHSSIVSALRAEGAHLSGADLSGGYAQLAFEQAVQLNDQAATNVWQSAGLRPT